MNFQDYSESIDKEQKITAEETFILTYTNSKNEAFSISPESIKSFLFFIIENYDFVLERWESVPTRKENFFQYEEKSYREIFKTANTDELKTISSAGRSQTKALTKLISKIIAFLTNLDYVEPEESTFFNKNEIKIALDSWNRIFANNTNEKIPVNIKKMFRTWMLDRKLSERTASSYSGTGVTFCDKFIGRIGLTNSSLYELTSKQVLSALEQFKNIQEWQDADKSGNAMYSSACKKLAEFLASIEITELPKPFLLLAGISGTGKTRFVREQAKISNNGTEDNYCLVPVRPDWHEPSDLLGYVSRLGNKPEYVATDVLRFIVQAWKEIIIEIERDKTGKGLPFDWRGKALHKIKPFWLCLDEMNLAPVEQYFSDYLSILETRSWSYDSERLEASDRDYIYECDPLIKGELFRSLDKGFDEGDTNKPSNLLAENLGLNLGVDLERDIWCYFLQHGIAIPFNLIVAGTVNMDETTHGFSRKVIDRALSFDFGEFFPNEIDEFFQPTVKSKTLSYPVYSQATIALFKDVEADKDAGKTKTFFNAINDVLKNTPFELAYRAFNELCLSVISFSPTDEVELAAVFDDFLMCKVLPRIEGDEDKLTSEPGDNVLAQLSTVLETELASIWQTTRPDLLRGKLDKPEEVVTTPCRSRQKIERMQRQLNNGFTSFWP
tara:strand:- start:2924 stop:4930 length:2007 start_codon:yes stop_codon:yes gene_type:complete